MKRTAITVGKKTITQNLEINKFVVCMMFPMRKGGIIKKECWEQGEIFPKNSSYCFGANCPSPWRQCLACVRHGTACNDDAIVEKGKRFCPFHEKNGPNEKKNSNGSSAFSHSFRDQEPTVEDLAAIEEGAKENSEEKKKKPMLLAKYREKEEVEIPSIKRRGRKVMSFADDIHGRKVGGRSVTRTFMQDGYRITILKPSVKEINSTIEVPIDKILPYGRQPRQEMGDTDDLAKSIKNRGQKQEVHFLKISGHSVCTYLLIDGHRRRESVKEAGKKFLRGLLKDVDSERELFMESTLANLNRKSVNVIDEAYAIADLKADFKITNEQVAEELGIDIITVGKRLVLLSFIPSFQALLSPQRPKDKRLPSTTACDLKGLPEDLQKIMVRMMENEGKGIRQVISYVTEEARSRGISLGGKKRKKKPSDVKAMIKSFFRILIDKGEELAVLVKGKSNIFEGYSRVELEKIFNQASNIIFKIKEEALK